MSKKNRKTQRRANLPASHSAGPAPKAEPAGRAVGFNPDYSYIFKDLKRIGLLAGIFILALIIGSFFLR